MKIFHIERNLFLTSFILRAQVTNFKFMATFRYLLLSFSQKNRIHINSKLSFYILLVAFVILLLATESIIKQTFVSL